MNGYSNIILINVENSHINFIVGVQSSVDHS